MADPIRLAYLVSEYPAVSHTFILREIKQLRTMNFDIRVASINRPAQSAARMTEAERCEAEGAFYVKNAGVPAIVRTHLTTFARTPLAYLRGLLFSIWLGGLDLRRVIFGIFYFAEAVMIGQWMESLKVKHLHVHFANAALTVALIASRIFPIDLLVHHAWSRRILRCSWVFPERENSGRFAGLLYRLFRAQPADEARAAIGLGQARSCPVGG